jgi:hypothetical protein
VTITDLLGKLTAVVVAAETCPQLEGLLGEPGRLFFSE